MSEKVIYLEGIDPLDFLGSNNSKFKIIKGHFPELKLLTRGHEIKAIGEKSKIRVFEDKINILVDFFQNYNSLSETEIEQILTGDEEFVSQSKSESGNIILYGANGKPVKARTINQIKLVECYEKYDLMIAFGPAGSGKTYTAIALAVRALKTREVRKIILTRPAVEAGEKLGYLPGDMKDKLDPYLQPLYDALHDMIPQRKLAEFMSDGTVQIAPLAYMRGRTLSNAAVILDEAQNTTNNQLKMFLTRMGLNSKFMVTGDITQIDLPDKNQCGLIKAIEILKDIDDVAIIEFDRRDIVRHKLVKYIVSAYEKNP
jgi:phosphate starvation-inducible protein PhoH and related proteins